MSNILKPLIPPHDPEIAAVLDGYPQQNGYILNLFRTFANSMRFLTKAVPNLLDKDSPLPLREREIVILRTTANLNCEYEWGVHVAIFAKAAGLSDAQVSATQNGSANDAVWSNAESLLIRCVDNLCDRGNIANVQLADFQKRWSLDAQLEIMALCGTYHTVSFVANSARLANEDFGTQFPSR